MLCISGNHPDSIYGFTAFHGENHIQYVCINMYIHTYSMYICIIDIIYNTQKEF